MFALTFNLKTPKLWIVINRTRFDRNKLRTAVKLKNPRDDIYVDSYRTLAATGADFVFRLVHAGSFLYRSERDSVARISTFTMKCKIQTYLAVPLTLTLFNTRKRGTVRRELARPSNSFMYFHSKYPIIHLMALKRDICNDKTLLLFLFVSITYLSTESC